MMVIMIALDQKMRLTVLRVRVVKYSCISLSNWIPTDNIDCLRLHVCTDSMFKFNVLFQS